MVWCWWFVWPSQPADVSPKLPACLPGPAQQRFYSSSPLLWWMPPDRRGKNWQNTFTTLKHSNTSGDQFIGQDGRSGTDKTRQRNASAGPNNQSVECEQPSCPTDIVQVNTCNFFCSMLISEYSCAVAKAAARAFFLWLLALLGTDVVMGMGVCTMLIGEFSGRLSSCDACRDTSECLVWV